MKGHIDSASWSRFESALPVAEGERAAAGFFIVRTQAKALVSNLIVRCVNTSKSFDRNRMSNHISQAKLGIDIALFLAEVLLKIARASF